MIPVGRSGPTPKVYHRAAAGTRQNLRRRLTFSCRDATFKAGPRPLSLYYKEACLWFTAQALKSLNELEMLVYQYVMEHRSAVPYMRIRELATEAHVSTTTVLHFCKKMGCEGFSQF